MTDQDPRSPAQELLDELLPNFPVLASLPERIQTLFIDNYEKNKYKYLNCTEQKAAELILFHPMAKRFDRLKQMLLEITQSGILLDEASFAKVITQTITRDYFESMFKSPKASPQPHEFLIYLVSADMGYEDSVKAMLHKSIGGLQKIMDAEIEGEDGKVNQTLLNAKLRVAQMLDKRVYGDYVQRIDQRSSTTVTHTKSSGPGPMTLEEIQKKRLELEEQRKQFQLPMPKESK